MARGIAHVTLVGILPHRLDPVEGVLVQLHRVVQRLVVLRLACVFARFAADALGLVVE